MSGLRRVRAGAVGAAGAAAVAVIVAAGLLLAGVPSAAPAESPDRPATSATPAPAPAAAAGPILAGAATRTITPDLGPAAAPVNLAGEAEGRIATGVRDDLAVRALVLDAGGSAVALVVLDLHGLAHEDVERIRTAIRGRSASMRFGGILVACTGTHAAPDATGQSTPPGAAVDSVWLERVVRAAADAVEEAWRTRQPARLSFASVRLPRLLSDIRQPQRFDDMAALLRVERAEGKVGIAAVAFFAGSPETLGRGGRLVSADYPGEARRALEDAFGGLAIVVVGASGGLMLPVAPPGTAPDEAAAGIGGALARALLVAWSGRGESRGTAPPDMVAGTLGFRAAQVAVPVDGPALREAYAAGRRRGRLDAAGRIATEVAVVTLSSQAGPVVEIACVPGAIYPELVNGGIQEPQDPAADLPGQAPETPLRSLLAAPLRLVAGTCGDDLGDIIPAAQWDEKAPFAYGLKAAQRGEETSPGPRTAGLLLRAFADLMR